MANAFLILVLFFQFNLTSIKNQAVANVKRINQNENGGKKGKIIGKTIARVMKITAKLVSF